LHAVSDRMSIGILLCSRAETEHLAGNPHVARQALAGASASAASVGAGPDSELGLGLARVRDLLGPSDIRGLTVQQPGSAHLLGETRIRG
jgi:hypothetical protein